MIDELRDVLRSATNYLRQDHRKSAVSLIQSYLERLSDKILQKHADKNNQPAYLVHYTSIRALYAILDRLSYGKQPVSLRAYDSVHVNDPDEGSYLTQSIQEEYCWLMRNETRHAHIASFIASDSEDVADDLIFWREYGIGGHGCSILIPFKNLGKNRKIPLFKVMYGKEDAASTTNQIRQVLRLLQSFVDQTNEELDIIIIARMVWDFLDKIRYLYKSHAYMYEREWRFVLNSASNPNVQFEYHEDQSPRIRHYVEHADLDVTKLLISGSRITLGPALLHSDNVRYCLEEMLQKGGLIGPRVAISQIAYRTS